MDGNVVVRGAVQLSPQVPGHHVSTGRGAGAVREGGCGRDHAEHGARTGSHRQAGLLPLLHAAWGRGRSTHSRTVSVTFQIAEWPFPQPLKEEE